MDIETFIQFADGNGLYFEHEFIERLNSLKLSFMNPETRHAYTYYVNHSELANAANHEMVISNVKKLITKNLLQ